MEIKGEEEYELVETLLSEYRYGTLYYHVKLKRILSGTERMAADNIPHAWAGHGL